MWDPVPWFVGGGAQHSPEVARLLAYAAFGGREGVAGPSDLRVRALDVPGTSVRVSPGACAILSRASGGASQAYAGRVVSDDEVPIAATGSGSGRSDLIVARVEDPFMPGEPWSDPSDPTGPYIFTRVIADVPPDTRTVDELGLGYSAIALARIDLPESTGTVTDAMITDLRTLVSPRRDRIVTAIHPGTTQITTTGYTTLATLPVAVPPWATQAQVTVTLSGLALLSGNAFGTLRAQFAGGTTDTTTYDENYGGSTGGFVRSTYLVADALPIGEAVRGTTQTLTVEGARSVGPGYLQTDSGTTIAVDIDFSEAPE